MKCDNCQKPNIKFLVIVKITRESKEKGTIDYTESWCRECFKRNLRYTIQ